MNQDNLNGMKHAKALIERHITRLDVLIRKDSRDSDTLVAPIKKDALEFIVTSLQMEIAHNTPSNQAKE